MPDEIDLFEAIHTQRAIRFFRPDPVPDHLITKLLEAAVKAPNGGNVQDWRFIVIRDLETRRKIGDLYRSGTRSKIDPNWPARRRRIYTAAQRPGTRKCVDRTAKPTRAGTQAIAGYTRRHADRGFAAHRLSCRWRPLRAHQPQAGGRGGVRRALGQ